MAIEAHVGPPSVIPRAGAIVGRLAEIWGEITSVVTDDATNDGSDKFISEIFGPMWREGPSGAEHEEEINNWEDQPPDIQALGILQAAFVSCGYAIDAIKAEKAESHLLAWQHLCNAEYWLGITVGSWSLRREGPSSSLLGTKGADKRHAEHRAMKADVFQWLDKNLANFRSLDSAAEAIAGKIVPVKFRTARDWVGDYKKLRSSGTP